MAADCTFTDRPDGGTQVVPHPALKQLRPFAWIPALLIKQHFPAFSQDSTRCQLRRYQANEAALLAWEVALLLKSQMDMLL
ncbi:hypothetical protein GN956_G5458 [Arapaima gigas]